MSADEQLRDEELAAFTDALLEGTLEADDSPRPPLAPTVEQLTHALDTQPVPFGVRQRVRSKIRAGWASQRLALHERLRRWARSLARPTPTLRWACTAAGVLAVIAVVTAVLLPLDGAHTTGTASGGDGSPLPIALALLGGGVLVVLGVAWLVSRRR